MKLTALAFFLILASFAVGQDPLGTINASPVSCPSGGIKASSCYALAISCPKLPNYTAYAKIIVPAHRSVGTVVFTIGGDVNDIYESYTYGTVAVQNVVNAGYTAVELTFGEPFSGNPGWQWDASGEGVRVASCRYATAVQWVHDNEVGAGAPLCATGNSAGGEIIAEGLSHYGLGKYLTFAEITSGPPFSRVDYGCINNVPSAVEYCSNAKVTMGVGTKNATAYVDPAYPGRWCSSSMLTHSTQYEPQFLNDSVTSPDASLTYPNTTIRFLFGGKDTSSAIRQGFNYQSQITEPTTFACVKDAPHSIPNVLDGAQTIATDLITNCHK
jgi:hypothetical protein